MTRSTALIVALVIAGGAVAALILVNGGGGSGGTPTVATTPAPGPATTAAPATTTSGRPEAVQVEETVTSYVSAAEEGDATGVCSLQVDGQGSGATSAQACASKAGIDLADLPALSRLKVQDVSVDGDRATASLGRLGEFTLRRSAGQWKVAAFKVSASAPSAGSGGASRSPGGASGGSSPSPGAEAGERRSSGGVAAPTGTGGISAP